MDKENSFWFFRSSILAFCFVFAATSFGQNVGVNATGTTPHTSAILDLNTGNTFTSPNGKGIVFPNVALTSTGDVTTCGTPATTLFVYNTATASSGVTAVSPGFYYYNGTKWIPFSAGSGWLITGNTGLTSPASPATYGTSTIASSENWLGTTDGNDIVFGTNNIERMRIKQSTGYLGLGIAAPTSLFHVVDAKAAFTSGVISTITGNSLNTGTALLVQSNSLTSGKLVDIEVTNTAATGTGLYVNNAGTSGNAIQAIGGGALNYSALYAQTQGTGNGTGYSVSNSIHAVYGAVNGTTGRDYSFGVYGQALTAANNVAGVMGYFASNNYGMLGFWDGSTRYGVYGTSANNGVYGVTTAGSGTAWNNSGGANAGVYGVTSSSVANYQAGVFGYVTNSGVPSAGVFGAYSTTVWGALGYTTTGNTKVGGYFDASTSTGTGRMSGEQNSSASSVGMAAYGDLFGGWIKGNVYGLAVRGDRASLYVDGKTIVNQPIAEVTRSEEGTAVNYASVSPTADLQLHGIVEMQKGYAMVALERFVMGQFASLEDLVIIATPGGQTNGVYAALENGNLVIRENNNGAANVKISWMIVGKRNVSNESVVPELKGKDFDSNLREFMHNENNNTSPAGNLWWDGQKLQVTTPPEQPK